MSDKLPRLLSLPTVPRSVVVGKEEGYIPIEWARKLTDALRANHVEVAERVEELISYGVAASIPDATGAAKFYYEDDTDLLKFDDGAWETVVDLSGYLPLTAGSGKPLTGNLFIDTAADPSLQLRPAGVSADRAVLSKAASGILSLLNYAETGQALTRIDPIPSDEASDALMQLFRTTNTSGTRTLSIYEGDGTATIQHVLNAGTGDADFCKEGGQLSEGGNDVLTEGSAELSALTEKVTPVSGDHLLIEDSAASNVKKRVQVGNLPSAPAGEANTASSSGSGTSLYYQKTGVDLEFNAIKSENNRLGVSLDGATHDIELTVNEGNIDHDNLANTHNLGLDINHDNLTNTHNLTTDIDHDLLTGFVGNEHIDWTGASAGTIHASNFAEGGTTDDHSDISDNDAATNVTGAELEELTDGSETTLHSHVTNTIQRAHLAKTSGAVQNHGGANGTIVYVSWDSQLEVGSDFTHSTTVNNSRIQCDFDGRIHIKASISAEQGGGARTTLGIYGREGGGTDIVRGKHRNYSRGANYGNISLIWDTEIEVSSGDYIEVATIVDDTDSTYTINSFWAECEVIMTRIE